MKLAFIDVGELGWSIYITAHLRWLKQNNPPDSIVVITYPDRKCLYEGLADTLDVPEEFYEKFDTQAQECFGINQVSSTTLLDFFLSVLPKDYHIPEYFVLHCGLNFGNQLICEPYSYSKKMNGENEILIFPRCRTGRFAPRNLPGIFYIKLIERLCDEFPQLTIRTVGTTNGAYAIDVGKKNYVNSVGNGTIQDFVDLCQTAVATVGSQSAPPKIALLQGVPTFMIGDQRERHVDWENWMSTRAEFYDVPRMDYGSIDSEDCIDKIIEFVKERNK